MTSPNNDEKDRRKAGDSEETGVVTKSVFIVTVNGIAAIFVATPLPRSDLRPCSVFLLCVVRDLCVFCSEICAAIAENENGKRHYVSFSISSCH